MAEELSGATFDIIERLAKTHPELRGHYARGTGGADINLIVAVMYNEICELRRLARTGLQGTVKPLVWKAGRNGDWFAESVVGHYAAGVVDKHYIVVRRYVEGQHDQDEVLGRRYANHTEAKAAAQADYEARILSALSPLSGEAGDAAVNELVSAADALFCRCATDGYPEGWTEAVERLGLAVKATISGRPVVAAPVKPELVATVWQIPEVPDEHGLFMSRSDAEAYAAKQRFICTIRPLYAAPPFPTRGEPASAMDANGWRDIDTDPPPMDGTRVFVTHGSESVAVGQYWGGEKWSIEGRSLGVWKETVTAWRPLLAPARSLQGGGE